MRPCLALSMAPAALGLLYSMPLGVSTAEEVMTPVPAPTHLPEPACAPAETAAVAKGTAGDAPPAPLLPPPTVAIWSSANPAIQFSSADAYPAGASPVRQKLPLGAITLALENHLSVALPPGAVAAPTDVLVEFAIDGVSIGAFSGEMRLEGGGQGDWVISSETQVACPSPGRHVLRARCRTGGVWGPWSAPLRFELTLPPVPEVVAVGDCDSVLKPYRKGSLVEIQGGKLWVRLSHANAGACKAGTCKASAFKYVAYVDGRPTACEEDAECGVQDGIDCCRICINLMGHVPPGTYQVRIHAVTGCGVAGLASHDLAVRWAPAVDDPGHYVELVSPLASETAEINEGVGRARGGAHSPVRNTARTPARLISQTIPATQASPAAVDSHAVHVTPEAHTILQAWAAASADVKRLANELEVAESKKKESEDKLGESETDYDIRDKALTAAKEATRKASTAVRDKEKKKEDQERLVEQAKKVHDTTDDAEKQSVAKEIWDTFKSGLEELERQLKEAESGLSTAETDEDQKRDDYDAAQKNLNEAKDAATKARAEYNEIKRELENKEQLKKSLESLVHAAVASGAHREASGQSAPKNPAAATPPPLYAPPIAFERIAAAHAIPQQQEGESAAARTTDHRFAFDHRFHSPAHFPRRGFGTRGDAYGRSGALIYEGMRFSADVNGYYEIEYEIETPAVPTDVRIQLHFRSKDRGAWYTVTLPTQRFAALSGDPDRPRIHRVAQRGYSSALLALAQENDRMHEGLTLRRVGTATFGFDAQQFRPPGERMASR